MARVEPLDRDDLAAHAGYFEMVEAVMGFVPNSMYTMARVPGLLEAFGGLGRVALGNEVIPNDLKQMVAMMASIAGGCQYCQAHTGHTAERNGVAPEKLAAMWEFESSDFFDAAERAALRLAFHAGQVPNATTDDDFVDLRRHFDDQQITAIVAVISFFGYLNRWNDTMATTLESSPTAFGRHVLGSRGWKAGKHA